jgi:hypothetical protein
MDIPAKWRVYECDDYFASSLAETGWWDEEGKCWYIERAARIYEDEGREFLVIGRPGVDGIEWGYRREHHGVWAHYPIDDVFVRVAESAVSLRDGYSSGAIKV